MKKIIVLILLLGVASCKSTKPAAEDKFVLENLAKLNAEEIKQHYPDATMIEDVGVFEEGTEELPYTILYPDTPNEIQVTWKNTGRTAINDIRFAGTGEWKSNSGVQIGSTIEELNTLNNQEIKFYGFGWDYSGAVDWNNGKFEDSNLRVFLAPQNSPPGKFYGDHIIEATPQEIENLGLRVQTIIYKI